MPINNQNITKAVKLLGSDHAKLLVRLAQNQDRMELDWSLKFKQGIRQAHEQVLYSLKTKGEIPKDFDFEFLVMSHYIDVTEEALKTAETEQELIVSPGSRLSLPKPRTIRSFKTLRELYDEYRRTGKLPARQKELAERIKKDYLNKVKSIWKKYGDEFRTGITADTEYVEGLLERAANITYSRAKTTVETETTNYYNKTRKDFYDQSDAIWGYLFLAIRDQATTKWCTDKKVDGKRGRHGLVFKKDWGVTNKERPACHWNCRSEFTPLTIYNPRHVELIENRGLWRINNECHPLPKGWNS